MAGIYKKKKEGKRDKGSLETVEIKKGKNLRWRERITYRRAVKKGG